MTVMTWLQNNKQLVTLKSDSIGATSFHIYDGSKYLPRLLSYATLYALMSYSRQEPHRPGSEASYFILAL